MLPRWIAVVALAAALLAGCARKHPVAAAAAPAPPPPPPPPPPANVFVLLPDPGGKLTAIVVSNAAGEQIITQPGQAVRVANATTAPLAPAPLDDATVNRLFGPVLAALPEAEMRFALYFDVGQGTLNAESQARIPDILKAVEGRHSTLITVTGHTDATGDSAANYQLGLRRAGTVAGILRSRGVKDADVFVTSHGDKDQLVKTAPGVAEAQNRRVEVIVR